MKEHTTPLGDDQLAACVDAACRVRAERVEVTDAPFDPLRSGSAMDLEFAVGGPQQRGRRRPVLAAAAVVALLGVGAAVVANLDDADNPARQAVAGATGPATGNESTPPTVAVPGPAGEVVVPTITALAPTADPTGTTLRRVTWIEDAPVITPLVQLFAPVDDEGDPRRVLVLIGPANPGTIAGDGNPVTVRGVSGSLAPSKVVPDRSTTLRWEDDGASVEARFLGYDQAQAIALIDALQWQSSDHQHGFAPAASSTVELVGTASQGSTASSARFEYADTAGSVSPGDGRQITLTTSRAQGTTMTYLETAFLGDRDSDGRVRSFDPAWGTLSMAWPDGRSAVVDANKTPFTEAELQAIVDGLVPIDGSGLVTLRDQVRSAESTSPVRATADVASGTVELRGVPERPVLCLVIDGVRSCGSDTEGSGATSLSIDGTWYVVAATDQPATVLVTGRAPEVPGQPEELAADVGPLGNQFATVATPRADVDAVNVQTAAGQNLTVTRPTSS